MLYIGKLLQCHNYILCCRNTRKLFNVGLGTVKDVEVSLTMKLDAKPRFFHPWSVPLALKEAVGLEIDRLEAAGILEKVEYSE